MDVKPKNSVRIPVFGRVAARIPLEAVEDIVDYEEIPEVMARDGDLVVVLVDGSDGCCKYKKRRPPFTRPP